MPTSRLQQYTSRQLSKHFGGFTIRENLRPEWLLNATGYRLELDFYIEELLIAVEVQGEQHYEYSEHMHGSQEHFVALQERDRLKSEACKNAGIFLIEVFDKYSADICIDTISRVSKQPKLEYADIPLDIQMIWRKLELMCESGNSVHSSSIKQYRAKLINALADSSILISSINPKALSEMINLITLSQFIFSDLKNTELHHDPDHRLYKKWAKQNKQPDGKPGKKRDYKKWLQSRNQ